LSKITLKKGVSFTYHRFIDFGQKKYLWGKERGIQEKRFTGNSKEWGEGPTPRKERIQPFKKELKHW